MGSCNEDLTTTVVDAWIPIEFKCNVALIYLELPELIVLNAMQMQRPDNGLLHVASSNSSLRGEQDALLADQFK